MVSSCSLSNFCISKLRFVVPSAEFSVVVFLSLNLQASHSIFIVVESLVITGESLTIIGESLVITGESLTMISESSVNID